MPLPQWKGLFGNYKKTRLDISVGPTQIKETKRLLIGPEKIKIKLIVKLHHGSHHFGSNDDMAVENFQYIIGGDHINISRI